MTHLGSKFDSGLDNLSRFSQWLFLAGVPYWELWVNYGSLQVMISNHSGQFTPAEHIQTINLHMEAKCMDSVDSLPVQSKTPVLTSSEPCGDEVGLSLHFSHMLTRRQNMLAFRPRLSDAHSSSGRPSQVTDELASIYIMVGNILDTNPK